MKKILVTSFRDKEGKTFVAKNLAISFALRGIPTLLIDANPLHPWKVGQERTGSNNKKHGLMDILKGHGCEGNVFHKTDIPGLTQIPFGDLEKKPFIYNWEQLQDFLETRCKGFEDIILDGPGVFEFPDRKMMSAMVDDVLLVTEPGRITIDEINKGSHLMNGINYRIILNKQKERNGFLQIQDIIPKIGIGWIKSIKERLPHLEKVIPILCLITFLFISCASPKVAEQTNLDLYPHKSEIEVPTVTDEELKALKAPDPEDSYTLGPEDVLVISVWGNKELTQEVTVRADGKISFPLAGEIEMNGLTSEQLKTVLGRRLSRYVKRLKVSVIVKECNSKGYYVLGKVNRPGFYPLKSRVNLIRAISEAQGIATGSYKASTIEIADLSSAFIARENQILPVDFHKLLIEGDMKYNILIRPGDFIQIPSSLEKKVFVLGEVRNPRSIGYRTEVSLLGAISEAGGFIQDAALLDEVKLIRGPLRNPRVYTVNVKDIFLGKVPDIKLERRDIIFVPATHLATWDRIVTHLLPFFRPADTAVRIAN